MALGVFERFLVCVFLSWADLLLQRHSRITETYKLLQRTSHSLCLKGYRALTSTESLRPIYQLLVDMASSDSSVWKRQQLKYTTFPWALAPLLDDKFPFVMKKELLTSFFLCNDCCLEDGYAKPLKSKFAQFGVEACLVPGSSFMRALVVTFTSKNLAAPLAGCICEANSIAPPVC